MQTKEQTIIIHFNKGFFLRFLKLLSLILLIGGIITLFIVIKSLLFTFVVSILLAFLLEPVVLTIESHDIKRMFAIFIVFASIAAIITIGVFFTFPLIKPEIQTISSHLQLKHPSVFAEEFATTIENNFPLIKQHGFSYDLTKYIHQVMDDLLKESFEIIFEFVHFVSLIFLVPVFTFFLLKDGRRLKKTIIQFMPNRYFEMTLNMVYKINQQIGRHPVYHYAQFIEYSLLIPYWLCCWLRKYYPALRSNSWRSSCYHNRINGNRLFYNGTDYHRFICNNTTA